MNRALDRTITPSPPHRAALGIAARGAPAPALVADCEACVGPSYQAVQLRSTHLPGPYGRRQCRANPPTGDELLARLAPSPLRHRPSPQSP